MSYMKFREAAIDAEVKGVYKDGFGNSKKLPSNGIDRDLVIKSILKRIRKMERNVAINANTWMGNENGVPQPRISL